MRAELIIEHRDGNPLHSLQGTFGAHDPAALAASGFATRSPQAAARVTYAAVAPGFTLLAWPTPGQLYLYVEASGGRIREVGDTVWSIVWRGQPALKPKLQSLLLVDEDANDVIACAGVGVFANLRRPEIWLAFLTGVGSAIWLALALGTLGSPGDLVLGAVPAFIAAIISLVILILDVRNKKLAWR